VHPLRLQLTKGPISLFDKILTWVSTPLEMLVRILSAISTSNGSLVKFIRTLATSLIFRNTLLSWVFKKIETEWTLAGREITADEVVRLQQEERDGLNLTAAQIGGGQTRRRIFSRYALLNQDYDSFLHNLGVRVPITYQGLQAAIGLDKKSPNLQDKSKQALLMILFMALRLKNPKISRFAKLLGLFHLTVAKTLSLKVWSRVRAIPSASLIYHQIKALSHGFADIAIVAHLVRTLLLIPPRLPNNATLGYMRQYDEHTDAIWAHFCAQSALVQQMVYPMCSISSSHLGVSSCNIIFRCWTISNCHVHRPLGYMFYVSIWTTSG
jgi:hypothetical protein